MKFSDIKDSRYDLEIKIDPDEKSLKKELEDALHAYEKVAKGIDEAFRQVDFTDTISDTVRLKSHTEKLSGQLSYLRMNLGSLRTSLMEAFAPIGNLVLPLINKAISRLRSFLHTAAAVMAAVSDQIFGSQALTDANEEAADSYVSMGAAARKSLAGFDQIERLNAPTGGGGGTISTPKAEPETTLTEPMKETVNKILQFLQPLLSIDFTPLKTAFQGLWEALQPVLTGLGELFGWLWHQVLAPFITWFAETLLPTLTDTFSGAMGGMGSAFGPMLTGIKLLWDALQPIVEFIRTTVVGCLEDWQEIFGEISTQMEEKGPAIATVFNGIRDVIVKVWGIISPILHSIRERFSELFTGIGKVAGQVLGALLEGLAGLSEFLTGVFTGDWKRAWNGIVLFFKGIVNSLIGMLNTILVKLTAALNAVVDLLNKIKITIPDWVPGLGGKTYQLSMKRVTAPQIPYLAKGAVLPANKPFLAMLGDQKHGTNIEAPLATIQQAMAATMENYTGANLAGHNATVAVLKEILEAVLGIEIGDETIARAAGRYQAKMAIVRGG